MPSRPRLASIALVLVAALAVACSSSDSAPQADDPAQRDRAVTVLVAAGLTGDEAACVVDELGAQVVTEAPDAAVLADGGDYQRAATACTGGAP